jgi:hypothetical protein
VYAKGEKCMIKFRYLEEVKEKITIRNLTNEA